MPIATSEIKRRVLQGDPTVSSEFCRAWLQEVSRTFALNIRVLPRDLEEVVRLAYLFMRIADTVEDDRQMPPEVRQELLEKFVRCFDGKGGDPGDIRSFVEALPPDWRSDDHPDRFLVVHCHHVFSVYRTVPVELRKPVDERVREMCGGMIHYALKREADGWFQLGTSQELLDYCYFVAGTVGLMLTDLFAGSGMSQARKAKLKANAVGFGLALQLVNIARDIPADGTRRTIFVPEDICQARGVRPCELWEEDHRQAASQVLLDLVRLADREVRAAQAYILDLPWYRFRLRLFCLWPLLMSQDTLSLLAGDPAAALAGRVKITRPQVRRILWTTMVTCWSNLALKFQFASRNNLLRKQLRESMA